jgi:purine-nucleoside phosphorylase
MSIGMAIETTLQQIRAYMPEARPRICVVLGSGWSGACDALQDAVRIPYSALNGFPHADVPGHPGELLIGRIGHARIAVMAGRKHAYESGDVDGMKHALRTLRALGCTTLVQTNAAGSLDTRMGAGSLMLLTDHINFPQRSPLVGERGPERFVSMVDAYDPELCGLARALAARRGVQLHEGVYLWCLGPQFETPAEIRWFQQLGAHAVGMSTVPETIIARHAGMKVLALSLVTNMAAGLSSETLSHAHTLAQAQAASGFAGGFLAALIEQL